ncbi:MAG TPA: HAD family hydrolase [Mucilaginibacter sp.]|jgi:phosphoserine phosphatase
MTIKLFIFDMDGVIFKEKNFWLDMHRAYKLTDTAYTYYRANYSRDYTGTFAYMANTFWKGRDAEIYFDLINKREYTWGIKSFIKALQKKNIIIAIISSGSWELAMRACKELDIAGDYVFANKLIVQNNKFTGEARVLVDDQHKEKVGLELIKKLGLTRNDVAFIGDTVGDISLANLSKFSIAYNSDSQELIDNCTISLDFNRINEGLKEILR